MSAPQDPAAPMSRASRWASWWRGQGSRFEATRTTEAMLGAVIIAAWAIVATAFITPPVVLVVIVAISLLLHFVAVDSGNFVVLWIATAWLLALVMFSAQSLLEGANPLVFTIAGASALAHNELIRAGYNRRRDAAVDDEVFVSSAVGVGLASLIAVVSIGITQVLAGGGELRSWVWLPVAGAAITLTLLAMAVLPTIAAPHPNKDRWRPGDRVEPHALTEHSAGKHSTGEDGDDDPGTVGLRGRRR